VFAALAVVLVVVVCFQADRLYGQGWDTPLGTLPEWLAALGSLSTLGVLALAVGEWRRGRRERRDQLANQARGIIVEAVPVAEQVAPANTADPRPDMQPEYRYVLIRNHSTAPVFNVHILSESPRRTKSHQVINVAEVVPPEKSRGSMRMADGSAFPGVFYRQPPDLIPELAPGQATFQLHLEEVPRGEQPTEYVSFSFTDARGARWRRLGSQQPIQEF
jgi:hypothetical protein